MLALRLIERKRDGGRIETGEWRALTNAYAAGHVPDYQMAAFLMACFLRCMDRGETAALTEAMLRSGDTDGAARQHKGHEHGQDSGMLVSGHPTDTPQGGQSSRSG